MNIFRFNYLPHICVLLSCLTCSISYAESNVTRLNDTGIQYGGDYPRGINPDCEGKVTDENTDDNLTGSITAQQDCATGSSAKQSGEDSSVFSYVKIDQTGKELKSDAEQWNCVIDQVSGLMWEVKDDTEGNLHFYEDKFTWYNSNRTTNGGSIGDWNNKGNHCHGYTEGKPRTYCHVEQFSDRVNKQGLCGFSDWRVPTSAELTSLIHFGVSEPAIDEDYFPNTEDDFYWAYNPTAANKILAWAINFQFGNSSPMRKTDLRPVRLVRSVNK